jgi:glycosyltransferase involved in cell wall biosynthesis
LEAYAFLKKESKTKNIKLVLCGNFKGFITGIDNLDQKIQSLGLSDDIHLPGYIADADLPAIYQSAFGFVFPSYYEGFGLPVLEAMAAKIPVVSSNYASLPEVGGNAVIYVDPMKPESIADGLEKVIYNPEFCAELVKLGWDQQAKFSWAETATEFKHTFDKVISDN